MKQLKREDLAMALACGMLGALLYALLSRLLA